MMLLKYWREVALFAVIAGVMWLGYHIHTLQDKASENAILRLEIDSLKKGQIAVAKFDTQYTKEASHVKKTDCLNQPMPSGIIKLLQ